MPYLQKPWPVFLLAFTLVLCLYGRTLDYGYVLDDDVVLSGNRYVQKGFDGFGDILSHGYLHGFNGASFSYRPLPLLIFASQQELFGGSIFAARLFHLLLYAAGGWMFWLLLRLWFPARKQWFALCGALLFLAHPIHTEVAANLKSLDELLAFISFTGTFIGLTKYLQKRQTQWMAFSLLSFGLGLLSKESVAAFLFLVPLCLWALHQQNLKRIFALSLPYLGVLLLYLFVRSEIVDSLDKPLELSILNNALAQTGPLDRLASSAYLALLYIYKLIWPVKLSWDYSYPVITAVEWNSFTGLTSIAVNAALLLWAAFSIKNRNRWAWLILGFYISLAIVLNLFKLIGSTFGERFLFTPAIFFVIALLFAVQHLRERGVILISKKPAWPLLLIVLLFSGKTISRAGDWQSNESLFRASLNTHPESTRVQGAMGSLIRAKAEEIPPGPQAQKLYDQALVHYQMAVNILPANFDAWYNMGVVYQNTGRSEEARHAFEQVLKYNDEFEAAYNNLAVLRFSQGDYLKAKIWLEQGLAIAPENADMLGNMGAVYHNLGNYEEARKYYNLSLQKNPNQPNVINNLQQLRN